MDPKKQGLFLKIALCASLASPLLFLSGSMQPWANQSPVGLSTQELIYPFEWLISSVKGGVVNFWEHYSTLSQASEDNLRLRAEINELKTKILDYQEKQGEINRLRSLLDLRMHHPLNPLVAEVVSFPSADPFYTIRIARGSRDKVQIGSPVVTAEGIVGRVIRTGLHFSDVQLATDANFNMDILLQRTRDRGVLKGAMGTHALLKLNKHAEIRIGDTLITSGIVGGYPKGLPVGRVVKISYESDHISQTISVEPWVDFSRLEEVIVLDSHDKELEKIIASAGSDWLHKSLDEAQGGG